MVISVFDSDGRGNCEEELAIISIIKDVSYMRGADIRRLPIFIYVGPPFSYT